MRRSVEIFIGILFLTAVRRCQFLDVEIGQQVDRHPYSVSIRKNGFHICSGAVIGPYTIITLAECVDPLRGREKHPELWLNAFRSRELTDKTIVRTTVESVLHPNYTGDAVDGYNIAMLRINTTANVRQLRILNPENSNITVDSSRRLILLGFGRASFSGGSSDELQVMEFRVLDEEECIAAEIGYIADQMFCTDSQTPCAALPGGPVIFPIDALTETLFGMASGTRCFENLELSGMISLVTEEATIWVQEIWSRFENQELEDDGVDPNDPPVSSVPLEAEAPGDEDFLEVLDLLL